MSINVPRKSSKTLLEAYIRKNILQFDKDAHVRDV